jgi:hypothetical protein
LCLRTRTAAALSSRTSQAVAMFCRSEPQWNLTHNPVSPQKGPELSAIGRVTLSRPRDALHRSKSILF